MIIVTGMHRSGTSLLAQWLDAAGVAFGDPSSFYQADEHNERGYLEERAIVDLNSRILTGHDRTGSAMARLVGQARYLASPGSTARFERGSELAAELVDAAAQREAVAVKDPRFCLTTSIWQEHVSADALHSCLVAVRHPGAVVDSLYRRQRIPRRLGLRFWQAHVAAALMIEDIDIVFVDMDRAMCGDLDAPAQALGALLGRSDEDLADAFRSVYEPRLVHASADDELPAIVRETYRAALDRTRETG